MIAVMNTLIFNYHAHMPSFYLMIILFKFLNFFYRIWIMTNWPELVLIMLLSALAT